MFGTGLYGSSAFGETTYQPGYMTTTTTPSPYGSAFGGTRYGTSLFGTTTPACSPYSTSIISPFSTGYGYWERSVRYKRAMDFVKRFNQQKKTANDFE